MATGTAVAQALPVLASPVLTRLYSPEAFGLFAVFIAIVSSVAPAILGTYELAVILPKKKKVAVELAGIAFWVGVFLTILSLLFILFFGENLSTILGATELRRWLLVVPFVIFSIGLFNLGNALANRNKNYSLMSQTKMWQAVVMVAVNLALGFSGVGFSGLLLGSIAGYFLASFYLFFLKSDFFKQVSFKFSWRKKIIAQRYADYPVYSGSSALLNGVTLALPVYFLSANYPEAIVGYFALVSRVVNIPFMFLSQAVFQVYMKRMVDELHAGGNIIVLLNKTLVGLLLFSIFPTLILLLWAPTLFAFVFGENWLKAGQFAQIMAPALAFRFVISTLSATYMATKNVKYASIRRIVSFVFVVVALWVASLYEQALVAVVLLSVSMLLEDVIALFLIYKAALNPKL